MIPLITVLYFVCNIAISQNTNTIDIDKQWETIDSLMSVRLNKSALDEVVKIYDYALANKDYVTLIKALTCRFNNQIVLSEDEQAVFDSLQRDINRLPQPAKSVGYAIVANMYKRYYTDNRQIRSRTRVAVVSDDIKTWDITRLFEEALKYYKLSVEDEEILKQTPLDDYKEIIDYDKDTTQQRIVLPTLYDFLMFNAITVYKSETSVILPQQTFVLDKPEYFADVNTFVNYRIETPDSLSAEYNTINLYQNLLKFRSQKNDNATALVSLDIERLRYLYYNGRYENNDALYENALKTLLDAHNQSNEWVYPAYALAVLLYENQSVNEQKNSKFRYKYKESYDLCAKIVSKYTENDEVKFIVELARKLQKKIAQPVLNMSLRSLQCSDSPILALVRYKNTDKLRLKIFSIDEEYLFKKYKVETAEFETKKPLMTKEIALPVTDDYQQYTTEIMIDGLPQGCYIVFVENTAGYLNNSREYAVIQVSPLNVVFRGNTDDSYYKSQIYVANAKTGEPLKDAKIDYFVNDNTVNTYRTNDDGVAYINTTKNEGFRKAIVTNGDERLILDEWNAYGSPVRKEERKIAFFTDRSIYRPGQTVYYKALYLALDDGKYNLLKNETVTVDFKSANNKIIATQEHKTNEYGSIQGSFTIPQGLLNGTMSLTSQYGTQHINVEEYKRPTFELKLDAPTKNYRLNDSVRITGKASALSGYTIDNAKVQYYVMRHVKYRIHRWWRLPPINRPSREIASGVTSTDDKGELVIDFKAEAGDVDDNLIYQYIVSADVTDVNGETCHVDLPVQISNKPFLIETFIPDYIANRNSLDFIVMTTNLDKNFTPADLQVTITALESPEGVIRPRLMEVPDTFVMSRAEFKKYFPLDPYGDEDRPDKYRKIKQIASYNITTTSLYDTISLNAFADAHTGWYRIDIKAKNADGIEGEYDKFVYLSPKPSSQGGKITNMSQWMTIVKHSGEPGEYAEFWVGGSEKKSYIHYDIVHKNRIVERKNIVANEGVPERIVIPVKEEHRGGFTVQFVMIQNGRTYVQSCHVNVPFTNKQLDITFKTFRNKLLPGEKEKWTLNVKNKNGEKETAEMLATLYDASLDAFRPHYWNNNFYMQNYNNNNNNWNPYGQRMFSFGFFSDYYYNVNNMVFAYPYFNKFGNAYLSKSSHSGLIRTRSMNFNFAENEEVVLEEVAIVAFGTQKKENIVGSIMPVADLSNAFAGRVTGITPRQANIVGITSITTRQDFNETAFFYPQLLTDDNGDISIEFTVPESLTRWKMLGFAHTGDFKTGYITNQLITQKQVAVSANAPRFFRENDTIEFTAKVNNITDDDLTGQAMLRLYDATTMQSVDAKIIRSPQTQSFDIKAGLSAGLKWTLIIPDDVQAICYKMTAQAGNHTDGEEKIIPVIKNSVLVTETMPFNVRAGKQKSITFKNWKDNNSSTLRNHSLTLEFTSNPAWYAVQAMPYLMEYPYECSEQTFSRFYANSLSTTVVNSSPRIRQVFDMWRDLPEYKDVLLSNLEKNQELKQVLLEETPWVMQAQNETERKKRIGLLFDLNKMSAEQRRAFDKVKKAQQNDGGFPWFTDAPSSYFITSHIISGFEHLKKLNVLGEFADEANNIISAGLDFLDNEIRDKYENLLKYKLDMNRQNVGYEEVKYLYTCSFSKHKPQDSKAFDYYYAQAKKYWPKFNLYAQAMIALAMNRFGDTKTATGIIRSLKERAQQSDEMGMYWNDNVKGYFWYQATIETQAMLIEAFNEIGNDNRAVEEMKIWLLRNKQTNDWRTTKATAEACYALLMTGNNLFDDNQMLDIRIGDKPLKDITKEDIRPEPGTGYVTTSWSGADIDKSMATITVANPNKNGTTCGGAYYWQYFEQLDKVTGSETSLKMNKRLFVKKITGRGAELQPLNEDNVLKIGDIVTVRMELRADRDYEFVHLKDMRAASLEPVKTLSEHRYQDGLWYYESIKDASVNFFITYLRKGTYVFEYDLRVTHAGQFSNGVTTFQCMYAPEFSAHSEGVRIKIDL
ncbi:MAG: hypothetical protein LBE04_00425 [Prevotellaceae bacterium]|jgi:hypothetical protein|nr:hypothetical protein [Prevotellaceae bacterium]